MKKHYKKHIKIRYAGDARKSADTIIAGAVLRKFSGSIKPVIIAVGGPGGTGKTTFSAKLARRLKKASVLTLDDYKKSRLFRAKKNIFGPHPEANNMELIDGHLRRLKSGKYILKPVYCRRKGASCRKERFFPKEFVIIEGEVATYALFHKYVDFSVFIDSHWKTQLNARIGRDIEDRGYSPEKALTAFLHSNLREFPRYGAESRNWADVHIHCDKNHRLIVAAVCPKNAEFFVDCRFFGRFSRGGGISGEVFSAARA